MMQVKWKFLALLMALMYLMMPPADLRAAERPVAEYVLGAEDVIEITVTNHPDLNSTVTIRPDGKITFPRAGEVRATGKTATALAAQIETLLARTLNHARVTVVVKEVHSRYARIVGAVKASGIYTLKSNWRVMDLVALAGGLSTKPTRITGRVIRGSTAIPFNVEQAVLKPQGKANVALQPNDLVVLEERDIFKQIHVVGQVAKPGAYDLEEGLTVVSLLAQAGGPLEGAALNKVYVMRGFKEIPADLYSGVEISVSSRASQIPLNLYTTLIEGVTDPAVATFRFEAGDVLVVPENQARFGIMGQVSKPAYYPVPEKESEATIVKALALAGGPLPDGDLRKATLTRIINGQVTVLPINMEAMLKGEAPDDTLLRADDILHIPEVDNQIQVIGQVNKPGAYELKDNLTVVSLLGQAGGTTAGAALNEAHVLRGTTQIPLDLYALLADGKTDPKIARFRFEPGDVLVVPESQVHVIGQVGRPGAYNLKESMTLMSLVSEAGSPTNGAGLNKAYVLRNNTQIPINLHAMLIEGKADESISNFKLRNGDVLVVPPDVRGQVHVIGQVAKPGAYDLSDNLTVVSLVAEAGSPTEGASLSKAYILRAGTQIPLNLHAALVEGKTDPAVSEIKFQPGDVLVVPENLVRYAVMGQVAKPDYYEFPEQKEEATVLKALSVAGGPISGDKNDPRTADLAKAGIIRTVNGRPTVIPVDIQTMLQTGNLASNVELQPEDILYIPPRRRGFKWTDVLSPLSALSFLGIGR